MILRPKTALLALGLAAGVGFGGLLAANTWRGHADAIADATDTATRMARVVEEHAARSLDSSDLLVQRVADRVADLGLDRFASSPDEWTWTKLLAESLPQVAAVLATDSQGQVVFTTSRFPAPPMDMTDRVWFQAMRTGTDFLIGPPVDSRNTGRPVFTISRRLASRSGEFIGAAGVSINIGYFQNFYRSLGRSEGLMIALLAPSGEVLVDEAPTRRGGNGIVAQGIVDRALLEREPAGTVMRSFPQDGTTRIIAYRQSSTVPVVAVVAIDMDAALAHWRGHLWGNVAMFVAAAFGIAILMALGLSSAGRQEATETALRQSEDLYRTIAANIPNGGVLVFDPDLRIRFADGKGFAEIDIEPHSLVGRTLLQTFDVETRTRLEPLFASVFDGRQQEIELPFRGHVYRVTAIPLGERNGRVEAGLGMVQDITRLKRAQASLEELSTTDGLLQIANRRRLDEALAQEWRRAQRSQEPLAVLMVDVDFFKLFNDSFGHLEGDRCLKAVAHAINQSVARPADLVARFGGEEMAVLLPNTDLAGARRVADRIHANVARLRILYPESPVADRVTVSIGIACTVPATPGLPGELVATADRALYAAKNAGRNRTVVAEEETVEFASPPPQT